MKIVSANFVRSAEWKRDYPHLGLREIAFAGRSNVGKSSLINTLLGRRSLAKTSKTPGHTRLLNFIVVNESFVFVDLPGYGYARVPEAVRKKWRPMVETYLKERDELAGIVVVMDSRHPLTEQDNTLIEFLGHHQIPTIIAATKTDKLPKGRRLACKRLIEDNFEGGVQVVLFSARDGQGKKELWKEIKNLID